MAPIHRFDSVPSTQDLLHQLAAEGAPAGTAVVAAEQTAGRGRRGHGWSSPRGGLWLSVLCRPADRPAVEVLSLRVALHAAAALEALVPGGRLLLKWPNDLLLGGRKLGGILCEARWHGEVPAWVAVGIGLNVANPIPPDPGSRAIGLADIIPGITPEMLVAPLTAAIAGAGEQPGLLTPGELSSFRERDWLLGRPLLEPLRGIAAGIEPDGALRVRTTEGAVMLARSGTVVLEREA